MISISLCMIVKNEEDVLLRCLESAQSVADEIIIVDTGSEDSTRDIALKFGCRVYDFEWCDDFSAARNFAFSKARMSHCMWLDADDVLTAQDARALVDLKTTLSNDTDVVMMLYNTAFDSNGRATFSYYRERIVRNSPDFRWQGAVHEAIAPHGKILHSDIAVCHMKMHTSDPSRNLRIFRRQLENGSVLSPREQFYYARELYYHKEYQEAITVLDKLIKSGEGWLENRLDAYRTLALCYEETDDLNSAVNILLASFSEDTPRAESCCALGRCFMKKREYRLAAYWYKAASGLSPNPESGAFIDADCYGFIPYIELAVCYDRLGLYADAAHYNDLAGEIKPDSPEYLHNKAYFDGLIQKNSNKIQ